MSIDTQDFLEDAYKHLVRENEDSNMDTKQKEIANKILDNAIIKKVATKLTGKAKQLFASGLIHSIATSITVGGGEKNAVANFFSEYVEDEELAKKLTDDVNKAILVVEPKFKIAEEEEMDEKKDDVEDIDETEEEKDVDEDANSFLEDAVKALKNSDEENEKEEEEDVDEDANAVRATMSRTISDLISKIKSAKTNDEFMKVLGTAITTKEGKEDIDESSLMSIKDNLISKIKAAMNPEELQKILGMATIAKEGKEEDVEDEEEEEEIKETDDSGRILPLRKNDKEPLITVTASEEKEEELDEGAMSEFFTELEEFVSSEKAKKTKEEEIIKLVASKLLSKVSKGMCDTAATKLATEIVKDTIE